MVRLSNFLSTWHLIQSLDRQNVCKIINTSIAYVNALGIVMCFSFNYLNPFPNRKHGLLGLPFLVCFLNCCLANILTS